MTVTQNQGPDGTRLDVLLYGYAVPLDALKTFLKREKRITQEGLGVLAAEYNGGDRIHQSTVSGYLRGEVDMPMAVLHTLESVLTPEETASIPGAQEFLAATPARELKCDPAYLQNPLLDYRDLAPPMKLLTPFPLEDAHQVAEMARKGKVEKVGSYRGTFSMRKLKLWGEAYYLLQDAGFSDTDALMGGFHVAAHAKVLPGSEDETFLLAAFDLVFGQKFRVPQVHPNVAKGDGNRHPAEYLAEPLVRAGIPVWFCGESATGKTWSAKSIASRLGREVFRVQGTRDTLEEDFVGAPIVRNGTSRFGYGALPRSMLAGGLLLVDELSFIPSGSLVALQAVLEGDPLVIKSNRGKPVVAERGFSIAVTDNTRGLGEGLEYVGTEVVNESIRDRFAFIAYDFMPPSQEKAAVDYHLRALLGKNQWGTKG